MSDKMKFRRIYCESDYLMAVSNLMTMRCEARKTLRLSSNKKHRIEELKRIIQEYEDIRESLISGEPMVLKGTPEHPVGSQVMEARVFTGTKIETLAVITGIDEGSLERWDADLYADCPPDTLQEIALAFNMKVEFEITTADLEGLTAA